MERPLVVSALLCLVLTSLLTLSAGGPFAAGDDNEPLILNPTKTGVGSVNCTTKDGRLGLCVDYTRCYLNGSIIKYAEPDQFELRKGICPGRTDWCCADDIITEEEILDGEKKRPVGTKPGGGTGGGTKPSGGTGGGTKPSGGNGGGTKPTAANETKTTTEKVSAGPRSGLGCGVPTDGLRQLSGKDMQYGECPWCVAIFRTSGNPKTMNTNGYFCTGSLIHPKVVLTAGNCAKAAKDTDLKVRVGDYDLSQATELFPHQEISVTERIIHEGYNTGTKKNNIALLILATAANIQDNVNTACLPRTDEGIAKPSTCIAGGWGRDSSGVYRDVLAKVQLSPIDQPGCEARYRSNGASAKYTVTDDSFCVEGNSRDDSCPAHHGAPLMCVSQTDKQRYVQYGVNSWTLNCGPGGTPSVYTDLAALRSWVDLQMSQRALDTATYTIS